MIDKIETGYYELTKEAKSVVSRVEIMAIAKNYVMWRRRGCYASACSVKSFLEFLNANNAIKVKK